jgi:type II secretory pathway component PulF
VAENREGADKLVDELLDRLGHTWPQSDAALDAWLHERSVPDSDRSWIKDVVRRRIDEARNDDKATDKAAAPRATLVAAPKPASRARRLAPDDLVQLDRELLELVKARVPLPVGLEACAKDIENGRLARVLEALRADVDSGLPLSEALARQGEALPPIYHSLVAAGEASGDVAGSLVILHEQAETDAEVDRRLRDALAYPAAILFLTAVGVLAAFTGISGPFDEIFTAMNVELPAITELTMSIGRLIRSALPVTVPLTILGSVGLAIAFARGGARLSRTVLYGRTPDRTLGELARSLAGFLQRGVPTTTAFRALVAAYGDRVPSKALEGVLTRLEDGSSLSAALRADVAFPRTFVWLVGAAEERGTLPETLLDLAVQYERRFKRRLKLIETFSQPAALIAMSGFVLFTVLAMFLPIFKIQQSLMQ